MRRRLAALSTFVVLVALAFLFTHSSTSAVAGAPQKRRQQQRRPATPSARQTAAARNKSRFQHDKNHVKFDDTQTTSNCSECHSIDQPWQYVVKDFPDHDKCLRCHQNHRDDFFTGARPPICLVCHKSSSPREARPRPFPKDKNDVTESFPGYFPHALHQNVIAANRPAHLLETWSLLRASFSTAQEKPRASEVESCATCHELDKRAGFFPGKKWPEGMTEEVVETKDGKPVVKTAGGTFRKSPDGWGGHETCFVCHGSTKEPWASQKPVANDCAGCHLSREQSANPSDSSKRLQLPPSRDARTGTGPSQTMKFDFTDALLPVRRVFKFQHEVVSHDIACTTCHSDIAEQKTLNILRPVVPIASCAVCHLTGKLWVKGSDTITISSELGAYQKTVNPTTKTGGDAKLCIGCHLPEEAARKTIPCDHITVLKPSERFSVKCNPTPNK